MRREKQWSAVGKKGGERSNGSPVRERERERERVKRTKREKKSVVVFSPPICSQKLYSLFIAFSPFFFVPN